jgi:glutamine synthetase
VAPDANPYLVLYTILKVGFSGKKLPVNTDKRDRLRFLPGTIQDAIKLFKASDFVKQILGEENTEKYVAFKQAAADRSPRDLGTLIKTSEIVYHHEVTNQALWNNF